MTNGGIGTGANEKPLHYAKAFFDYVKERYSLRGEVVRREGFSSTLKSIIYFGKEMFCWLVMLLVWLTYIGV